ncbi:hypothetical protein PybrP1_010777 [[Pythium] brassicae (nom. inval.)]|nr:hypothetical protein PybrP1_010777 [[Pythium] brassicae (nom. inval.)]
MRRPSDDSSRAPAPPLAFTLRRPPQLLVPTPTTHTTADPTSSSSPLSSSNVGVFFALDTPVASSPPERRPSPPPTLVVDISSDRRNPLRHSVAAFFRINAVQRVASAAVLAPLVTFFLWRSPAFATATVCAFVTSLCAYEYAWLAHRIHVRVLDRVASFEQDVLASPSATGSSTARQLPHDFAPRFSAASNRDSRNNSRDRSGRSTRSAAEDEDRGSERSDEPSADPTEEAGQCSTEPNSPSPSTRSHVRSQSQQPVTWAPTTAASPDVSASLSREERRRFLDGDMFLLDVDASRCAISDVATRYFCGYEWLTALVLACPLTLVMSTTFLLVAPYIPELEKTELYSLRVFYAIVTDYVASLSALFAPNWSFAFICVVEKAVFTLLTLHSTICPINQFGCGLSMEPAQVFLSGAVIILLFRLHVRGVGSSSSVVGVFLHVVLDMLGYLYIVGSLSVIVAFVDDEQLEAYRKLLIVLLYVVWASDTGAYLTGKLLAHLKYQHYNPLAAHLSKNKDYEGTIGAIVFGIAAMYLASRLLEVNGSAVAKVSFTVLAVVAGRVGDLFESLLKRAAGVKDSGKLIPGHGGMLDRIDALMFASLVFARYYALVIMPGET